MPLPHRWVCISRVSGQGRVSSIFSLSLLVQPFSQLDMLLTRFLYYLESMKLPKHGGAPELTPTPVPGPSESEDEARDMLEPSSNEEEETSAVAQLCREGGVTFLHFLISKAITPSAEEKSPKEWTYRDIITLPDDKRNEWRQACEQELDTLQR